MNSFGGGGQRREGPDAARPATLGELRGTRWEELAGRSVREELRHNVIARLRAGAELFPGIHAYRDSVEPQLVNALLSGHDFILLGLRGQAKTRLLRQLAGLLDAEVPVIRGSELNDDPFRPLSAAGRALVAEFGEDTPVDWLPRGKRYVEKLATPDVTVADLIGDLDPIAAAGLQTGLADERALLYGLLPRANRGIFSMNELPDLAARVQVALFNVLQEGDIQIRGFPVRLPLDVLLVFSANPEDYTARGRIITPLKDRIGSEIRTHYPRSLEEGMAITLQEARTALPGRSVCIPAFIREVVERTAFIARDDRRLDARSGVSQRLPASLLELAVSAAEQRALRLGEARPVVRVADVRAGLPAITGRIEPDFEGELLGAEKLAQELVTAALAATLGGFVKEKAAAAIVGWFEAGNVFRVPADLPGEDLPALLGAVPRLLPAAEQAVGSAAPELLGSAAEFILEGLHAAGRIGRSEELGFMPPGPGAAAEETASRRWN